MVLRCAHCNEPDSSERPLIKRFFPPGQPGVDEYEAVEICDAIKKIFEWKCNGKRRFRIEKRVQVCHECGTCLGKLYAALVSFEYLKKPDGYVHYGLLKDQAEEDIQRYREQVRRKSIGLELQYNIDTEPSTVESSLVDKKPLTRIIDTPKDDVEEELVTPDDPLVEEEPEPEDEPYTNDLAMQDDEEGDPDWGQPQRVPVEKKVHPVTGRRSRTNRPPVQPLPAVPLPTVVLGVDDAPPSPRAAEAPVVDLEHKSFRCGLCPKGFGTNQGLRTHLLLTHEIGNKAKEHICLHCGKSFFYEYLLKNHLKVHSDEKPIQCAICPSRFKTKLALVHHQKNVHAASDRPFKCIECGRAYKEARSLREHVNITHNAIGPVFKCKYECGSTTSRKRSMLSHYRRCRSRPGAENEGRPAPKIRRRGPALPLPIRRATSTLTTPNVRKEKEKEVEVRIGCRWNCGKTFRDKRMAMRHNVYNCTQRPQKAPQLNSMFKTEPQELKAEPFDTQ